MTRVLFVSNGHGESAIAERIARETASLASIPLELDHLALVGEPSSATLVAVGPRRTMPSGGLVAMGNLRALARDVAAGFASLLFAQLRFLRRDGRRYDCVVAVGDVYALMLAKMTGRPAVAVGTAKSVFVAPYGRFERMMLARAARVFVRDAATAADLRAHGVAAESPGNVIVELADDPNGSVVATIGSPVIAVLPGSREAAYDDAVRLCAVIRELGKKNSSAALLSIAASLDAERFAAALASDGWTIEKQNDTSSPFRARAGDAELIAWTGGLGAILAVARIALGLAGTANEQAAAAGVPVVVLDLGDRWYRMRQRRLLGAALTVVPVQPARGAAALAELLSDEARLERMRAAGRERMGARGGARAIAAAILEIAAA